MHKCNSRYNRSRKQYIFFSDRIVNHVSPNHTVARAYNCPENFILRLYLPFSIEKHASIILEPEGIKKEKKKEKTHNYEDNYEIFPVDCT